MARATSSRLTSRRWPDTATTPRLFWLLMWLPPTATNAELILYPERRSAFSTLAASEFTVWSMLATIPFFIPTDGPIP